MRNLFDEIYKIIYIFFTITANQRNTHLEKQSSLSTLNSIWDF